MPVLPFLTSYPRAGILCLCLSLVVIQPARAVEGTDPKEAYALAEELRKTGRSAAEWQQALDLQQMLFTQGNKKSLLRVAQLHLLLGQQDAALQRFEQASAAGSSYARFLTANHHAQGDFGAASTPEVGLAALRQMAVGENAGRAQLALAQLYTKGIGGTEADGDALFSTLAVEGNSRAASVVLRKHERRGTRLPDLDVKAVVAAQEAHLAQGDRRAATVLARAYLRLRRYIPNAAARHRALVADHMALLPEKTRYAEVVSAEYDRRNHRASARALTAKLEPVTGESFTQAALRLRGIERTSFVYLLQKELAALQAYSGPVHGKLTRPTLQALLRYCRAQGGFDTCKHGPLNYDSSLLIARAIGMAKETRRAEGPQN
ncbi:hypothetical protein SAMN04488118_11312 [Epibacterium ulvae]|uniref:TPR repeat n=1 Tax=Epibacterium ulvae TaxID=1156985 RepID=A0A1G5RDK1_9RHOB|nr:hypothetical protein [Epibacterium ulvae]SCZ71850.1 hypothetical protein SAMN04488118_11312 [Epibacterium ulvae]